MSERVTLVKWPAPEAEFEEHVEVLRQANAAIPDAMIVPADGRFQVGFTTIATGGGQYAGVQAKGDRGSGKTVFGSMMFGEDTITEIDRDSTKNSLFGHRVPGVIEEAYQPGDLTPGLLSDLLVFFGNEVSHLKKTGSLHELYDKEYVETMGRKIRIARIALYATTNFPNGNRVNFQDDAFMSRQAMEFLSGAMSIEDYYRLHGNGEQTKYDPKLVNPLMPVPEIRDVLHEGFAERLEVNNDEFGKFYVDLMLSLEESGLVQGMSLGDRRATQGLLNVARARLITDRQEAQVLTDKHGSPILDKDNNQQLVYKSIGAQEAANVAGLVIPTQVNLSNNAVGLLAEAKGETSAVTAFEQAVALRRVIARFAFQTLNTQLGRKLAPEATDKFVSKYSYGSTFNINVDIESALFPKEGVDKEKANELSGRLRRITNGITLKRRATES